ncbi:MAG: hypothetical protein ACJ0HC_02965 [Gammaproteobacteria bacterium]
MEETLNCLDHEGPEIGGDEENPWFRVGTINLRVVRYRNTPFMDLGLRLEAMESME